MSRLIHLNRIAMYVNVTQYLVETCKRVTMLVLIVFDKTIYIPLFVISIAGSGNLFEIEKLVTLTCSLVEF